MACVACKKIVIKSNKMADYELIICEKPNSAKKIAEALADGKAVKKDINKVPYYEVTHGNKDLVIGCAVGHLYTVAEKDKGKEWTYPVFDVEWKPSSQVSKSAAFSSKYLTALKKLAKDAKQFTIATDYDIEGEVIGLNILKYACKKKDAKRMKFSTLTKDELRKAYDNASSHLNWGQANAGTTRHVLDYYYGINLSRALTLAIKTTGGFKVMSSGRVQGPALKIIVDKEREIKAFKPEPFWDISLFGKIKGSDIKALHKEEKFWEKKKAEKVMENVKGKKAVVDSVDKNEFKQNPPYPFDMTTLQTEAYRTLGIQPKETASLAQTLYTDGLISYPRTSSQKLPPEIDYKKILNDIAKQDYYKDLAKRLLEKKELKPNEGKKSDPAHPAIYPTGLIRNLDGREAKLYDLIVRRFLATFSDPATRETVTINIDVNKEIFVAKGTRTTERGWYEFYGHFVKLEEIEMPKADKGEEVKVDKIEMLDKETSPPKRYTPASIIKELEKRNLGTKATRASIVEALYNRGYVYDKSIRATDFGIRTCEILEKYSPLILDEELTRHFEEEMEKIIESKINGEQVLEEAKKLLIKILDGFKAKEKEIGKELAEANIETRDALSYIGKCPKCDTGLLQQRKGKFGRFIACNKYPDCKTTFSLPAKGFIKSANKECEDCKYPLIFIHAAKRKPQIVCINPDCPSKEIKKEESREGEVCPKCKEGKLILRNSIYGKFYGCNRFPKCMCTEKIEKVHEKEEEKVVEISSEEDI